MGDQNRQQTGIVAGAQAGDRRQGDHLTSFGTEWAPEIKDDPLPSCLELDAATPDFLGTPMDPDAESPVGGPWGELKMPAMQAFRVLCLVVHFETSSPRHHHHTRPGQEPSRVGGPVPSGTLKLVTGGYSPDGSGVDLT